MPTLRSAVLAGALASCALFCACVSASSDASTEASGAVTGGTRPPRPWPVDFQSPAVLVAEEVHVEGPPGLLEHVAIRIEPAHQERSEETTPDGYLQTVRSKPGSPVEIRAYLDLLEIAALARLTVLERPGEAKLVVRARGDVYFVRSNTGEERRGSSLELIGSQPAPAAGGN